MARGNSLSLAVVLSGSAALIVVLTAVLLGVPTGVLVAVLIAILILTHIFVLRKVHCGMPQF